MVERRAVEQEPARRRVVVTGLGLVCGVGKTVAEVWEGLLSGRSGMAEIKRVVHNPTYHYDPRFAFKGVKTKRPFTIAAGPNNPVGSVWIDLSIESYGIHGTPEPGKIGATFSHGCIRLTNWDAEDLASMVQKGTKVNFKDDMTDASVKLAD